jgi:UDPglucose 6-dehydrogenase
MNKTSVIGIGRLGLCFALNLEKAGFAVWGVDTNETYVNSLKSKTFCSNEPQLEEYLIAAKSFYPVTNLSVIFQESINFIYLLLPTPSLPDGNFSHKYIDEVIESLIKQTPDDGVVRHIIIGSTVMPGYCDALAQKVISFGYTITYNPEFIAQGTIIRDQQNPDQILIGEGHPDATTMLKEVYDKICTSSPAIHVMNRKSAEICKLATNCYLTMKISFANSIGDLAIETGAEAEKILAAIGADSRIGKKYLQYGFGFGGPCFPRDNQALLHFAKQSDQPFHLSQSTIDVNKEHLAFQLKKMLEEDKEEYVFDYVTYKKDTDIIDESQQLLLAVALVRAGKKVILKNSNHVKKQIEKEYPGFFYFT